MRVTVRVPEQVKGPQPERVRSICAGVNATRTSGTGPERDRNGTGTRTGTSVNTAIEKKQCWHTTADLTMTNDLLLNARLVIQQMRMLCHGV